MSSRMDSDVKQDYNDKKTPIYQLTHCSNNKELLQLYDLGALDYDQNFSDAVLSGPSEVAKAADRLFPECGPRPRSEVRVMDVAAGTGQVGAKLKAIGFGHIDGLEPSENMLKVLNSLEVYQRQIQDTIGDHRIDVEDDVYDLITIAGAFVPQHLPLTSLDECIRICKPGGYIVNCMRYEYLVTVKDYQNMEAYMDDLEKTNLWHRVDRYIIDKYFGSTKQGIVYIYQKL